jgi:toxin ParE1/3/4
MKRLVRRSAADADVLSALEYLIENAPEYALSFIDDLDKAYQHLQNFPESGSTRYAFELDLPALRVWKCNQFPYLIFYVNHPQQIEVWRVLHSKQDIPPSLQSA